MFLRLGASRGFAFVEFSTVHDATRWMEAKQGVLLLNDAYRATLQYSIPKDGGDRQSKAAQDWYCIRCGVHNFKRRDSCFKCAAPRHESEPSDDGSEEACNYPTYKLVLRGLDVLTTEEGVLQAIQHASTDLPIKSVRIGRDPLTNISRGVCFVELDSVYDAMTLFNKLMSRPPTIDGKQITISYCKLANNQSTSSSLGGGKTNWGGSDPPNPPQSGMPQTTDINELAEYSASLYAQTPEEHASYVQYYTQYYQQQQQEQGTQSDSVNAAAAVAQSALQAMQHKTAAAAAAASSSSSSTSSKANATATTTASTAPNNSTATTTAKQDYPTYPTPDVSTYQYDETSGYYYDPSTGLYYDANTCYYYNAESGQYLYWDSERSTYMPAPASEDDGSNKPGGPDKKEKDKDKQEKVKVAKKIAKDMERWAKAQNKRNEGGKSATDMPSGNSDGGSTTGAADAAFAVLLERRAAPSSAPPTDIKNLTLKMQIKKEPPTPNHNSMGILKKSGLVAAYGGEGSDEEDDPTLGATATGSTTPSASKFNEDDFLDLSKMACLLCKRQFPSREMLNKHVKLSSLHKTNLEAARKSAGDDDSMAGGQYRDRAEERRKKYGMPNKPPPNKLKEKYMSVKEELAAANYEEPTKLGIGSDNIGNKLLKKMGWNDGQGLGKSNQGRTEIIEAKRRINSVGLGVQGSSYTVVGDTYKDCVKKMMYHRYQELDAQEKEDQT